MVMKSCEAEEWGFTGQGVSVGVSVNLLLAVHPALGCLVLLGGLSVRVGGGEDPSGSS